MERVDKTHGFPGIELGAVAATGLLHVLFQGPATKGVLIALVSVSWVSYIGWRVRQNPGLWKQWGFRTDNLRESLVWPTIAFIVTMMSMTAFAMSVGRQLWNEHLGILLLLYPVWGVLQQFLVQALGVANIRRLFPNAGLSLVVAFGACLFSIVHYPEGWLMLATGIMACVFIPCYLRHPNLWVLGVYHGWLGTLFYLWVLNQDPWVAAFGS